MPDDSVKQIARQLTGPGQPWILYMIRGADNSLYTGITSDIERRFKEHCSKGSKAAKSLKGKAPLKLVFSEVLADKSSALIAEYRVKQLPKTAKEQLVSGVIKIESLL